MSMKIFLFSYIFKRTVTLFVIDVTVYEYLSYFLMLICWNIIFHIFYFCTPCRIYCYFGCTHWIYVWFLGFWICLSLCCVCYYFLLLYWLIYKYYKYKNNHYYINIQTTLINIQIYSYNHVWLYIYANAYFYHSE